MHIVIRYKIKKIFSKCYVGRNGKRNLRKYTYKCVDPSRHNRIKNVVTKCVRYDLISIHLALALLFWLCLKQSGHLYVYFLQVPLAIPTNKTFGNGYVSCISYTM